MRLLVTESTITDCARYRIFRAREAEGRQIKTEIAGDIRAAMGHADTLVDAEGNVLATLRRDTSGRRVLRVR